MSLEFSTSGLSCGICEVRDLIPAIDLFLEKLSDFAQDEDYCPRHIVFSDAVCENNGTQLAELLKNYGTVIKTEPKENFNSGNDIEVFVFTPNDALVAKINKDIGYEPPDDEECDYD